MAGSSVATSIEISMRTDGWVGDSVDVVRMPDNLLTSLDNSRILAAQRADIDVSANLHAYDELIPGSMAERFPSRQGDMPSTWGQAVESRISNQAPGFRAAYPQGSPITGWSGN